MNVHTRRAFLLSSAAGLTGLVVGCARPRARESSAPSAPDGPVTVVEFSDDGAMTGTTSLAKVVKTEAEWRRQLSPLAYEVTREESTERAFTGPYWDNHEKGLYRCICCDTALFTSATKFDSGTGWPSFWQPISERNVREITDSSFGMTRTAVACIRCDAHLGHVFDDGPRPTGLRYCINGVSLKFIKA